MVWVNWALASLLCVMWRQFDMPGPLPVYGLIGAGVSRSGIELYFDDE